MSQKSRLKSGHLVTLDSTYLMFKRALELKDELTLYSARHGGFTVTNSDWELMEKLIELLGLFHSVTKNMSYRYANAGEIIPFVKILKDYVSDELNK